jgi:prophage antirepressor-like protein
VEFPLWLTEVLQKRLETATDEMRQDSLIHIERTEFDILFLLFIRDLSKEKRAQFLRMEESWTRLEGLEKEWIYKRGIKDGAQLIASLLP